MREAYCRIHRTTPGTSSDAHTWTSLEEDFGKEFWCPAVRPLADKDESPAISVSDLLAYAQRGAPISTTNLVEMVIALGEANARLAEANAALADQVKAGR